MTRPGHMPEPCDNCPFRRDGGVRLRRARIIEISGHAAAFPCHKTINRDRRDIRTERDCTGALIFAYKVGISTQMMRISERLGMIDPAVATGDHPATADIFDDLEEMLETADDGPGSRRGKNR